MPLGAILSELITGQPPFLGKAIDAMPQEALSPLSVRPQADKGLATIAMKCLEREPAKRYESAAALANDLARLAGQSSTHQPRANGPRDG